MRVEDLTYQLYANSENDMQASPFVTEEQFRRGSLQLVDVLCGLYAQINHNDTLPYSFRGLEITEEEFQWALYGGGERTPLPEAADAFAWWLECLSLSEGTIRFCEVRRRLSLGIFEQFLALLALAPELNRKYEKIFAFLQNDVNRTRPTLGLAVDLYSLCRPLDEEELTRSADRYTPSNRMLFLPWKQEEASRLARPLGLWKTAVEYLLGTDNEPDALAVFCRRLKPQTEELLHHTEQAARCRRFLGTQTLRTKLLYVYGEPGVGKRFFLSTLVDNGNGCYLIDMDYLREKGAAEAEQLLAMLVCYCGLRDMVPLLYLHDPGEKDACTKRAVRYLRHWFTLVCVSAERMPWQELLSDFAALSVELDPPDAGQQEKLWNYYAGQESLAAVRGHVGEIVSSYHLNPAQIQTLAAELSRLCEGSGYRADASPEQNRSLWAQCRELIRDFVTDDAVRQLGDAAKHIRSCFTREDLVLPPDQGAVLDFVIQVVRHQYRVLDEFGFGAKLPYGRGISVLLYGPPGTGKTMTAQVLAAQTGLELFRVDVSKIMDKYIGETEKKLGSLFDVAEKTNSILFFDEADAFFAKRTQVGSSNDKYSNAETAYLLQRMENYRGMTVLATNHSNYFDEAFRRRITYSINIPMPDEKTRQRIWEGMFPEQLAVDQSVSFAELAEKFPFSGSSIKYVALEAAYAAAIAKTAVTRACIRTGLQLEYAKSGRVLGVSEYPAESLLRARSDDE